MTDDWPKTCGSSVGLKSKSTPVNAARMTKAARGAKKVPYRFNDESLIAREVLSQKNDS